MKNFYYYVVLYKDDTILPIPFNTWESAENYIFSNNLHAYITIK